MAESSVVSAFKFESYKVDKFNFQAAQSLDLLLFKGLIPEEELVFNIVIRHPIYFEKVKVYVGGINISLFILNNEGKIEKEEGQKVSDSNKIFSVECGIAGVFSVENGRLEKEVENSLVFTQIPALLLPYLRGTLTSLLANAGFGVVLLPLINIHEVAKQALSDVQLQIISE